MDKEKFEDELVENDDFNIDSLFDKINNDQIEEPSVEENNEEEPSIEENNEEESQEVNEESQITPKRDIYGGEETVEIHYDKAFEPHSTREIELAEIRARAEKEKALEELATKEELDKDTSEEIKEETLKEISTDEEIKESKKEDIEEVKEEKPKKEKKPINKKALLIGLAIVLVIAIIACIFIFLGGNKKLPAKKASEITTKAECEKYKYHWWESKQICVDNKKAEEIKEEEECKEFGYNWWYNQKICSTEKAKLSIVDETSTTRPFAVMINNHNQARPYHSGLDKANIVYELLVEGGITRLMAVFKDKDLDRIGSVRSSRHDFLDYALENDAIYVHFGWSPQAESDIKTLGINNVNGLYDSGFYRDTTLPIDYEHTAQTSTEGIKNVATFRGYRMNYKSDDVLAEQVLKYSVDKVDISKADDSIVANSVEVPYSYYMTSSYTYDSENEYYLRFANGTPHTDYVTKEQYHFKNIIIQNVGNHTLDDYGRQEIENVGNGTGYFITNGYARPITWEKSSRQAKTVYKYLDGEEIVVNDGNTFIQLQPSGNQANIS